jgi:hypothetical protein
MDRNACGISAIALVTALGCGSRTGLATSTDAGQSASCAPTPVVDAGAATAGDGAAPLHHRPAAACCPSQRGPGPSGQPYPPGLTSPGPEGCSSDSQCTAGVNGRCFPFAGLVGPGGCSYDECFTDSACGSKMPCLCRRSPAGNSANVCVVGGNCAVDSDCGPGGYCSPSFSSCGYEQHYYCHTALDACLNDTDCPSPDAGASCATVSSCAYDVQQQHWACRQDVCCPP